MSDTSKPRKPRVMDGREERVFYVGDIELREAKSDDDPVGVTGHAAVWDKRAWIGPPKWGFAEQFQRGAFSKAIGDKMDVRYLFNHNPDAVLARTKSGTLRLNEDAEGLAVDADLAPTTLGRDLALLLERGDVDQMSVGMQVVEDRWEEIEGDDGNVYELRTIISAKLFDVSAVTYPAYEETDAGLRTAEHARELRDARGVAVERRGNGAQNAGNTGDGTGQATATPPAPAPAQGGSETPEGPAAGGLPSGTTGQVTTIPAVVAGEAHAEVRESELSIVTILRRHADGMHTAEPRLSCPACTTRQATATG